MKKRAVIIFAILLLAVGFAAISTTLIINGDTKVSENTDNFSVIFSAAILDGEDVYNEVINDTKQTINFSTSELKTKNQTSILNYEVTNNSSNYDAEITVNCKIKDNAEAKYTSIKNELEGNTTMVKAKETLNGTLTITLNKTSTEEVNEDYVCELTFNAVERNELGLYTGTTEWIFDYTGGEEVFIAPTRGTYKIETWGASGGNGIYSTTVAKGGYGGYSVGTIELKRDTKLFINVGKNGMSGTMAENTSVPNSTSLGGYNGGGDGFNVSGTYYYGTGGGGGATHIATISGTLDTFENKIEKLLIVSGGGGGASLSWSRGSGYLQYAGGSAGGYIGLNGVSYDKTCVLGIGGTQESTTALNYKGILGVGGTGDSAGGSGGGGGYYGGSGSGPWASAGGGSGYIGNSLLTEKSMYCYNCTESTEELTKTISTTCVNEIATENCAKQGNGYARISLIK